MKATLRKVGGSVILAVPPAILDTLELAAGSTVGVSVDDGRMIIEPVARKKYTLDELLANYEPRERTPEIREWLESPAVGREIL